jgi:hypothetical protein
MTLEEGRRDPGRGKVVDRVTDSRFRHLWEEALLPAKGRAGGETGQVGGEGECRVPACPLPASFLLLSAFSSLSDSF